MWTLVMLLLACGVSDEPTTVENPAQPVAAPSASSEEASGAPTEPSLEEELPDGFRPMTLLMMPEDIPADVAPGTLVDVISGEGDEMVVVASGVQLLGAEIEERGTRVRFAFTDEHRSRLLGSKLPARPRVVLHQ